MDKWVYNFGKDITENLIPYSKLDQKNNFKSETHVDLCEDRLYAAKILGNKGANLAEMAQLGIPVPPGFTISTTMCNYYFAHNRTFPDMLIEQVDESLKKIEDILGLELGNIERPLLLSIRSGASISMPGMMDTILNLGLNDATVKTIARNTNNERFALDCYRRFIQMYGEIVMGVDRHSFENILELSKQNLGIYKDSDLPSEEIQNIIDQYKMAIKNTTGLDFPQDTKIQLWNAINAVFDSWMNPRAQKYRQIHHLSDEFGTAVNIQSMVFGNLNDHSATGVAFTRNPSDGSKQIFGEYLINAQGEDVVAGIRTPQVISKSAEKNLGVDLPSLEEYMPDIYKELEQIFFTLEKHYKDMQDIEFTIEQGKIWILQTRSAKRSAIAAVKIAVQMYKEGLISKEQAILNVSPESLEQLLHPTIAPGERYEILARGLPASPGAASGKIYFDADTTEKMSKITNVILVRQETSPEDIHGMHAANGILTTRGGMTSHAAVVARGMGKCCVCGANEIHVNYAKKEISVMGKIVKEGETITINGTTGEIILGEVKTSMPDLPEEFELIMSWAMELKKLQVRANAETTNDTTIAHKFHAEGIGLCRTEHMFFANDRINVVREMILADNLVTRKLALEKLLPMQVKDFVDILKIMGAKPINIRLLDPPLHEFLPNTEKEINELSALTSINKDKILARIAYLHEHNPMLGHRGCRIAISYPEIYEMQAKAINEAAQQILKETGVMPNIEIMIPLVFSSKELSIIRDLINQAIDKTNSIKFTIGTMIELPRACMLADEIAKEAEFFSFGTNDLTQTTLGISRDDCASFLDTYIHYKILHKDPFVELDLHGVGSLIKIAVEKGRSVKKDLKIGICGEHGANPESIKFFHNAGFDYISCSAYRLPIAILAAAHAAILA